MIEDAQEIYRGQIEVWRAGRERALAAPDGWLSLVGLFPLADGEYTIGSGDHNQIILPESAPSQLGTLIYAAGKATLIVSADVLVTVNEREVQQVEMLDNSKNRQPTLVRVGTLSLNLHRFGEEVALRVRDSQSPAIQEFKGCRWYPIKPEYCVQGRLMRQPAQPVAVTTSVSTIAHYESVGAVSFEIMGKPLTLLAAGTSKADELFIIFRDATAGRTTYGAGRYLYAPVDAAGNVTLDFNKAYSPPCAFTPYATCSLSPAQNVLAVAIDAGELYPPQLA